MKKTVTAIITWVMHENGGRKNPMPINTKYYPIIIFSENAKPENDIIWSADITIGNSLNKNENKISLTFLVDEAPFELLEPNARFTLYEGPRLVATGVITE